MRSPKSKCRLMFALAAFCSVAMSAEQAVAGTWHLVDRDVVWQNDPAAYVAVQTADLAQQYRDCLDLVVPWGGHGSCYSEAHAVDGVGGEGAYLPGFDVNTVCSPGSVWYEALAWYIKTESKYYWYVDDGEVTSGYSVQKNVCE